MEENSYQKDFLEKSRARFRPKNPFDFQEAIINNNETLDIAEFAELCHARILLANIATDDMAKFYQVDIRNLTNMYSFSLAYPIFRNVFLTQYWAWVGELQITRAMDGKERELAGATGTNYIPNSNSKGFGLDIREEQLKKKEQSIIDKLLKKREEE